MIDKIKKLKNHAGFMKYFFNTGWMMLDKVLRLFLGLFVGVWVARYLGPEDYGVLSFSLSFVGLFGAFSKLGLDGIIVRNIVSDPEERDKVIGTSLGLRTFGVIVLLLSVFGALQLTSTSAYEKTVVMIIAVGQLFMSFEIIGFYFQSQVQGKYFGLTGTYGLVVSSALRISFILLGLPLLWFAVVVVIEQLTKAVFFVYFYLRNNLTVTRWSFSSETAKSLLKDSWPLIISGMALMVQARIDQVMIKEIVGTEEVGFYSVALKLIEIFGFIPMMLKSSLLPAFIKAKKISQAVYENRLLNYYRFSFILFLLVSIPIFIFSEKIVVLLFGIEYRPAGILLSLMAIRLFFTNMGTARAVFINVENLFKFSFFTMLIGTITNVLLNLYMIPLYGSKGAVVATIISFAATIFAVDIFYKKTKLNVYLQIKSMFTFYKLNLRN